MSDLTCREVVCHASRKADAGDGNAATTQSSETLFDTPLGTARVSVSRGSPVGPGAVGRSTVVVNRRCCRAALNAVREWSDEWSSGRIGVVAQEPA